MLQRLINALCIVNPVCADVVSTIRHEPWEPYEVREQTRSQLDSKFEDLDALIDAWSASEPTRRTRYVPPIDYDVDWKDYELQIQQTAYQIIQLLSLECEYLQRTFPTVCICMHVRDASCVLMYSVNGKVYQRIPEFGHVARNCMGFTYVIEDAPVLGVDTGGFEAVFEEYKHAYEVGGLGEVFALQVRRYRNYIARLQAQKMNMDEPRAKKILLRAYPEYPRHARSLKKHVTFGGVVESDS